MPKGFLASVLRLILTSFRQEPYEFRRQMPLSRKIRRSPFALALHFLSGLCTFDMGRRAFELKQHHLNVLERLVDFCKEKPDTVCGLSRRLFKDRHGPLDSILAVSETQAHISYLWAQGRVTQHLKADGSFEYRLA